MTNEDHILITGASGFIGTALAAALLKSSPTVRLTLTDVAVPSTLQSPDEAGRVTAIKSDLTSYEAVESLLSVPFIAVYLLHGLMSGGAEANFELGWKINWDSHRNILDYLRRHFPATVVVFPSSLAVYGPSAPGAVTSEDTRPLPQSSYGAQKLMVETYLGDLSHRGFLDGRIVRLPTVIVRPGAPSAAASSFASGIVREPLQGQEAVLPVERGLEMWVCSPRTVVDNLVRVRHVPAERFGQHSRVVNLPGITVTVQQILDALAAVGRLGVLERVREERNSDVEAIVGSWPARFDITWARNLGLEGDGTLEDTVRCFAKTLRP